MVDEPLEAMEKEYAFSELSSAFGPTEFADALSQSLNTHVTATQKVLGSHGLVNRYQRMAQEKYTSWFDCFDSRAIQFERSQKAPLTVVWWTLETRLWDLIRRIYEYRCTHEQSDPSETSLEETRIILTWLTETHPRITDTEYIPSTRWLHTREHIKMRKLSRHNTHADPIISELDPDATLRQGKGLMAEDDENERNLLKQVFGYLRIGDIKSAQQVCRDSNNFWRAASLSGNKENVLWRKTCFQLARQPQMDRYERAVYGAVCGDLDSVVPVCMSWEDQMWAHFNAIYAWKLEEVLFH